MTKKVSIKATVYDKRGMVLAVGYNSYTKTHPRMSELGCCVDLPFKIYMHSEVSAIIKALRKGTPYKIFVERYGKDGEPRNAEPCPICKLAIKEAGIQIVEYTVG